LGLFNFGSFGATTDLVTDSVLELTVWHLFIIYFTEAIAEVWWILTEWFLNYRARVLFFHWHNNYSLFTALMSAQRRRVYTVRKCPCCSLEFRGTRTLTQHINRLHGMEDMGLFNGDGHTWLRCDQCQGIYSGEAGIRVHQRTCLQLTQVDNPSEHDDEMDTDDGSLTGTQVTASQIDEFVDGIANEIATVGIIIIYELDYPNWELCIFVYSAYVCTCRTCVCSTSMQNYLFDLMYLSQYIVLNLY